MFQSEKPGALSGSLADGPGEIRQLSAAEPICFAGTIGLYTPDVPGVPGRDVAVLFASPWGLEDLSARKFFRVIADCLAAIGVPSLRFDYPGTGDALDPADGDHGLEVYEQSLVAAAACLKQRSRRNRIVIIGQGLGSVLALRAETIAADGAAVIAPFSSGRGYLRELSLWARVVDDSLALDEEHRNRSDVSIAGFVMPPKVAAHIKSLNLKNLPSLLPASILMAERPDRPSDREVADRLEDAGAEVTRLAFTGYDALVANPTRSVIPHDLVCGIVEWVSKLKPALRTGERGHLAEISLTDTLQHRAFSERPVRFGAADRLYGILCEPISSPSGALVVLFSSAYDRQAGWGGLLVKTARRLAQAGVASLRFDGANVADSPPLAGGPDQVLYSEVPLRDAEAVLDFVSTLGAETVIAYGRCSGGYVAYRAAVSDPRWKGLVVANPPVFYWDAATDVDQALVAIPRSLDTYARRPFQLRTYKRLLAGQLDIKQAIRNSISAVSVKARLSAGKTLWRSEKRKIVDRGFDQLLSRGLPVELIYSDGDPGYDECLLQFGNEAARRKRYPNVNLTILPRTDHNITPEASQNTLFEVLHKTALAAGKTSAS